MLITITRAQLIPKGFVPDARTAVMLDEAVELCNEVQEFVQRQCTPTSGIRTLDDVARLVRGGYNPSPTSDHLFGLSVPYKGITYTASVGAVDLYIPGLRSIFLNIVNYFLTKYPNAIDRPRQMIFETSAKGNDWLHIANVPSRVLSPKMALASLHPRPLLYSFENGKTGSYKDFDPKNPPLELSKVVPIVPIQVPAPVVVKPTEAPKTVIPPPPAPSIKIPTVNVTSTKPKTTKTTKPK